MVSRHVNPSSYFLMNIDRISDNEPNQISRTAKKTIAGRGSSQFYQNHHANMFVTEISAANRNYLQTNSHFRGSLAIESNSNRPIYRGTDLVNINSSNNNLRNNNNELINQQARPRCTICNII